ncbi:hypothetical protein [uncultured Dokdonia sp.]|uniref:hypothetical protein n=1 Tax=uncultured Dokdonia sp. TaxID=575653 RepID=UPI00260397E6|nr:hypothetical protein [uncultured Dokdonia sp.]
MLKKISTIGKILNKKKQQSIIGGSDFPDIIIVSNGVCIINGNRIVFPCNETCPDGTDPFCAAIGNPFD